jgi:potassium-transporting ATPase potassium-binding subunit
VTGATSVARLALYLLVVLVPAVPLGLYLARVLEGRATFAQKLLGPLERTIYRLCGIRADEEMDWKRYAVALLLFNLAGFLAVYLLLRLQGSLPLNPNGFPAVPAAMAFNTASSFVSNTNWQAYAGESTMSHLSAMAGLTVQNFLSGATGIAVMAALIRGFYRREVDRLGSFWVDLVRAVLYLFLPLSLLMAIFLVSQGMVQTFAASVVVHLLDPSVQASPDQILPLGPVASQVAIKMLGTNGGGFFNANSAHPFENPTPVTDLSEMATILLVPAACCVTFGRMVGDRRQGFALLATMVLLLVPMALVALSMESHFNPTLSGLGLDAVGGNMEGKELRFGPQDSALWATVTTAASSGSVNAAHDSLMPLAGLVPLALMQIGEVVFGGVGSGLYGMILYAVLAVFIAGLMVGRTPEYLCKKIEAFEVKMACLGIFIPAAVTLGGAALACLLPEAAKAAPNPGPHGFSEMLYAFSSAANNNGSAFAGLDATGPFYTLGQGIAMLLGRYFTILPVLALAGALGQKKSVPPSAGTLPTHTPLFVGLLACTVVLLGALTFLPSLALGPIVEHLRLFAS